MENEYLFVSPQHREDIGKYENEKVKVKILQIKDSDCWIATVEVDNNNKKSAKMLSDINNEIVKKYHPTILKNECSAYYNKTLFPLANDFERQLRKLLYLKSSMSKDIKGAENVKNLDEKDLGTIFGMLFADDNFVQMAKKKVNDKSWIFTKKEIIDTLLMLDEHKMWDDLIGENAVLTLRSNFGELKKFRNDIMHAHNMDTKNFEKAKKLFRKVNSELNTEINRIIAEAKDEEYMENAKGFNTLLGEKMQNTVAEQTHSKIRQQLQQLGMSDSIVDAAIRDIQLQTKETINNITHELLEQFAIMEREGIDVSTILEKL